MGSCSKRFYSCRGAGNCGEGCQLFIVDIKKNSQKKRIVYLARTSGSFTELMNLYINYWKQIDNLLKFWYWQVGSENNVWQNWILIPWKWIFAFGAPQNKGEL